jgi:hypothetical protein
MVPHWLSGCCENLHLRTSILAYLYVDLTFDSYHFEWTDEDMSSQLHVEGCSLTF